MKDKNSLIQGTKTENSILYSTEKGLQWSELPTSNLELAFQFRNFTFKGVEFNDCSQLFPEVYEHSNGGIVTYFAMSANGKCCQLDPKYGAFIDEEGQCYAFVEKTGKLQLVSKDLIAGNNENNSNNSDELNNASFIALSKNKTEKVISKSIFVEKTGKLHSVSKDLITSNNDNNSNNSDELNNASFIALSKNKTEEFKINQSNSGGDEFFDIEAYLKPLREEDKNSDLNKNDQLSSSKYINFNQIPKENKIQKNITKTHAPQVLMSDVKIANQLVEAITNGVDALNKLEIDPNFQAKWLVPFAKKLQKEKFQKIHNNIKENNKNTINTGNEKLVKSILNALKKSSTLFQLLKAGTDEKVLANTFNFLEGFPVSEIVNEENESILVWAYKNYQNNQFCRKDKIISNINWLLKQKEFGLKEKISIHKGEEITQITIEEYLSKQDKSYFEDLYYFNKPGKTAKVIIDKINNDKTFFSNAREKIKEKLIEAVQTKDPITIDNVISKCKSLSERGVIKQEYGSELTGPSLLIISLEKDKPLESYLAYGKYYASLYMVTPHLIKHLNLTDMNQKFDSSVWGEKYDSYNGMTFQEYLNKNKDFLNQILSEKDYQEIENKIACFEFVPNSNEKKDIEIKDILQEPKIIENYTPNSEIPLGGEAGVQPNVTTDKEGHCIIF
jgi:hypothetical protein